MKIPKDFKVKYYDNMRYFCKGILIYWLKEIHIDKRYENTPIGNIILQHELTHLKFINKVYEIERNEQNKTKKILKMLFLAILNNLWDYLDCFLIELKIILLHYNKKI